MSFIRPEPRQDDSRLARGIVMGVLLSVPLWGVLALLWWWVG